MEILSDAAPGSTISQPIARGREALHRHDSKERASPKIKLTDPAEDHGKAKKTKRVYAKRSTDGWDWTTTPESTPAVSLASSSFAPSPLLPMNLHQPLTSIRSKPSIRFATGTDFSTTRKYSLKHLVREEPILRHIRSAGTYLSTTEDVAVVNNEKGGRKRVSFEETTRTARASRSAPDIKKVQHSKSKTQTEDEQSSTISADLQAITRELEASPRRFSNKGATSGKGQQPRAAGFNTERDGYEQPSSFATKRSITGSVFDTVLHDRPFENGGADDKVLMPRYGSPQDVSTTKYPVLRQAATKGTPSTEVPESTKRAIHTHWRFGRDLTPSSEDSEDGIDFIRRPLPPLPNQRMHQVDGILNSSPHQLVTTASSQTLRTPPNFLVNNSATHTDQLPIQLTPGSSHSTSSIDSVWLRRTLDSFPFSLEGGPGPDVGNADSSDAQLSGLEPRICQVGTGNTKPRSPRHGEWHQNVSETDKPRHERHDRSPVKISGEYQPGMVTSRPHMRSSPRGREHRLGRDINLYDNERKDYNLCFTDNDAIGPLDRSIESACAHNFRIDQPGHNENCPRGANLRLDLSGTGVAYGTRNSQEQQRSNESYDRSDGDQRLWEVTEEERPSLQLDMTYETDRLMAELQRDSVLGWEIICKAADDLQRRR